MSSNFTYQPKNNIMKYILLFIFAIAFNFSLLAQSPCATIGDRDKDGICDDIDPCPDVYNPNPVDSDGDGVYDACDNCPRMSNSDQEDLDMDGIGDVCDACVDPDGDGVCGANDKCPGEDDNIDVDLDGIPDACDDCIDVDRDDICDDVDDCISTIEGTPCDDGDDCTINDQIDKFCNCIGNVVDTDGDGVCDVDDQCPGFDDRKDYDQDGIPDACDSDPVCSNCEVDDAGKMKICQVYQGGNVAITNYGTCEDLARYFDNLGQFINEQDHCGPCECADSGDKDSDGDGVCDRQDPCPNDPLISIDTGCGCYEMDSDGDGVCDSEDRCPGADDNEDSDGDGIPNACDSTVYCVPQVVNDFEGIAAIMVDDIVLMGSSAQGFYFHDNAILLENNEPHILSVRPDYLEDICELSIRVYADWDQDGSFEGDGEMIGDFRSIETVSLELDIADVPIGQYRLRAIVHYGRIHSSCQAHIDGEVEDFIVSVIEPLPCEEVSETFDYAIEQPNTQWNGGVGWMSEWTIGSDDDFNQVSIVAGSLAGEESGNKLGILNANGYSIVVKRSLDVDLSGSDELYVSILVNRMSGHGTLSVNLGDLEFGLSGDDFYLMDQIGDAHELNTVYELYLKILVNQNGAEEIMLWINPSSGNPDISDALVSVVELSDVIMTFSIETQSSDSFVPLTHFIDDIQLACDDSTIKRNIRKSDIIGRMQVRSTNTDYLNPSESGYPSIAVWPNPVKSNDASVIIKGGDGIYPYKVIGVEGRVIATGTFLGGLNKLPLSNINSGIYYLSIGRDEKVEVKKIIVAN